MFQNRVYPLQDSELPALLVNDAGETSVPLLINLPQILERVLRVEIIGVSKAVADLDDTLRTISKQVKTALAMPVTGLNSLAKIIRLVDDDKPELEGVSEKPAGAARMVYEIDFYTYENAPDVAL